jgi:hypothetical protein
LVAQRGWEEPELVHIELAKPGTKSESGFAAAISEFARTTIRVRSCDAVERGVY